MTCSHTTASDPSPGASSSARRAALETAASMLVIAIAPSRWTFSSRRALTRPSADSRATSASTRSPAGETDAPGRTARCAVPGSLSNSSRTRAVRSGGTVTRSCSSTPALLGAVLRGGRARARRVVGHVADLGPRRGALGADRSHRAEQDLADVQHLHVVLRLAVLLLGVQRVAEHRDAE